MARLSKPLDPLSPLCPLSRLGPLGRLCRFRPTGQRANGQNGPNRLNGQSILEYLILITALVLVLILALRGRLNGAVDNLYSAVADKVDQAAANLRGM